MIILNLEIKSSERIDKQQSKLNKLGGNKFQKTPMEHRRKSSFSCIYKKSKVDIKLDF